jgi:uncharacterized protein YndB with AHSA1/START domain
MITRNNLTTAPLEREIVMTRFFDAPRKLIFKTYTDPNLIPEWWGPKKSMTTVVKMDVRPGGIWQFVQRGSDDSEYVFNGMYHEIAPPDRLIQTFEFEGLPDHVTIETITFEEEHGGKTKLTSKSFFQTVEDRDMMLNLRVGGGAAARMDRLAELLKEIRGGGRHSNE